MLTVQSFGNVTSRSESRRSGTAWLHGPKITNLGGHRESAGHHRLQGLLRIPIQFRHFFFRDQQKKTGGWHGGRRDVNAQQVPFSIDVSNVAVTNAGSLTPG